MLEKLKDIFAFYYKRFCWGYDFIAKGIAIFNFVGIFAILLGGIARSYIVVPSFMILGFILCVFLGWLMFDKFRFKTKFAEQEGDRNEYWNGKLSPVQVKLQLMLLDAIGDPAKIEDYKKLVKEGKI